MKIKYSVRILVLLITIVSLFSCKKDNADPALSVSETELSFSSEGGTMEITITSNDSWSISNAASAWLQLSQANGNSGTATVQLTAGPNAAGSTRSAILTVNSNNGQSRRVTVSQTSLIYPSYNVAPKSPDASGMSSTVVQLAA